MKKLLLALFCLTITSAIWAADTTRHVFFLHNKIMEDMPDSAFNHQYGAYEYGGIINALKQRGYIVYANERPYGTDPDQYSWLVAKSIDSLLKDGVAGGNITVVGSGKGALITMLASSHIRKDEVKYIVLSGCNEMVANYFHIDLFGTILSVTEKSDDVWISCDAIKNASSGVFKFKEVQLNTGLKNGYLYKPMDEWLSLVYDWVEM